MTSTLYEALGIDHDATPEQISKAYRKKARETHPDHGGDAEEFKALAIAYEVLSDEQKRDRYDKTGQTEDRPNEVQSIVAALLREAFNDDRVTDPIRWMLDKIDRIRSDCKSQKDKTERKLTSQEKKLDRFLKANDRTKNTEARDFISNCLKSAIESLKTEVANFDHNIQVGTEALAFLNDIRYPKEKTDWRPPVSEFPGFASAAEIDNRFFTARWTS